MAHADPTTVLDLIDAFRRSKTMFTAVSLGIFDRLHQAEASAAALAVELDLHPGALERLLNGCVGLGLLTKSGSLYFNTSEAETYLRRESPDTLTGYILYSDQVLFQLWGHLEDAIREGTHRWDQTFGGRGALFDHFFRTPEARQTFLSGMHGLGQIGSPAVVRIFNLNQFRQLVDLGGATGHLAIAACERYGNLRATVFDLPAVVESAKTHIAASRAADRLSVAAGDFFTDPLPPADLYAVGRILHDWSDDKIHSLLTRIHAALPPGGAVLVAETLLDEDSSGPVSSQMQSLNMLICTEGRERTATEYQALLESCCFTRVEARRTGAPLDAVLAFKKE
ncbi:methyltransferase [uncultured Paludibaculum sp.]|uniref:methyltransferase n=1 Tax=uncultured Paludibaculum sp. TaxID=1765020 RepID=UPI002AAB7F73|nr:methyltransferase [uncultured Paludibaculum sp.]